MKKNKILNFRKPKNSQFFYYMFNLIKNNQKNLLATMPKSGTWYCQYFFWSLNKILKNKAFNILDYNFKKNEVGNIIDVKRKIFIGHATCPGYEFEDDDLYKEKWDELKFWHNGFDWVNKEIDTNYCPQRNPNSRIVYIYRDPLSQIFSSYNYAKNHTDKYQRECSKQKLIDFYINLSAVNSYIKQYHTFCFMKKLYPKNIKLIKYKDLIENPSKFFLEICNFYKILNTNDENQEYIDLAIKSSSIENLKLLEKKNGYSLANDGTRTTHIQGTKFNSYKEFLTKNDIEKIEKEFNRFSYSLKNF